MKHDELVETLKDLTLHMVEITRAIASFEITIIDHTEAIRSIQKALGEKDATEQNDRQSQSEEHSRIGERFKNHATRIARLEVSAGLEPFAGIEAEHMGPGKLARG